MRKLMLAAILVVSCTGLALAADIHGRPLDSFPEIRSVPTWSGPYIGLNGGGGWAETRSDFSAGGGPAFASAKNPLSGGLGGRPASIGSAASWCWVPKPIFSLRI